MPATFFNSTKSGNVAPFGTESTFSASTSLRMTNGCGPLGLGLPGVPPLARLVRQLAGESGSPSGLLNTSE